MRRLCLIFFYTISFLFTSFGQPITLPDEAKPFVLKDHEVLDYATGDLNADKKPDAILILKPAGEDSAYGEELVRPFLILIRQGNGQLKQVLRNDKAIMCRHCGGIFGDPYQETDIHNKGFSISFYGGSSWRWAYQYDFVYRPAKNNWYLVKESQSSFNSGDPDMTMKNTDIKESELGEISLAKFSSEQQYEDSRWKVIAAKTFFYDSPELGSKPRKGYLVKGNIASGIRQFKNFIEVNFDNGTTVSTGFILRKDLLKLK
jgi:hypothetical protein